MKIGAHVSTAGGLDKAIDRGKEMGCEAVQLFCSSPQSWAFKPPAPDQVQAFRTKSKQTGISPAFLHGIYLVNLGTANQDNLQKGLGALVNYMDAAAQLGALGVIFHAGGHGGAGYEGVFRQTVTALQQVLSRSPQGPWLVMENSAGMGNHIGATFEEIGRILRAVKSPRLKVCLDTQHTFAAGYDIARADGLERAMKEFDKAIRLENLVAVHANDSKGPLGSGVDRHENIGKGHIGVAGFETIMGHRAFRDVPFLLEVPGSDGEGPDKENVDLLKAIRKRLDVKP